MKNLIKFTTIVLFTSMFSSCVLNKGIEGNGNVTTENREINSTITEIQVSNAIDVKITQGNIAKLEVTADSNLLEHIETSQDGSILYIKLKNNLSFHDYNSIQVAVTLPNIYHISASSASKVSGFNTIISKELTLKASSSAEIEIAIETEHLSAESSSASEMNLSGKAINAQFDSSSSSSIKAGKLLANNVIAKASSASDISCAPIINLDASASSSGDVKYVSKPKYIKKSESSAGSVTGN